MRKSVLLLPVAVLAAAAISCGTPPPPPKAPEVPPPPPKAAPAPSGPALLPAQLLASLDDENAAPYFARRGAEGLVLYSSHGRWSSRAVGADGAPKAAAPVDLAAVASEPGLAALKPVADGYLAVWSELVAKNHAIKAMSLDVDGKLKGEPLLVLQVTDEVTWLDVLPNQKGALVVWEIPRDDRSDVFAAPVVAGKVGGPPSPLVQGVLAWEAEATERGAVIAMVSSDAGSPRAARGKRRPAKTAEEAAPRGPKLGKVLFVEVDAKGHATSPVVVSAEPTAEIDVTIAEVGGKYLLGWTDERHIDASVYLAVMEAGGKLASPPRRATAPFGEQALVSIVAESYYPGAPRSARAMLAWEDQLRAPRESRLIHLATVGADGAIGKERAGLVFSAGGAPDLEPDGDGFAALTLAPVRDLPPGVTAQPQIGVPEDTYVWPAFVRFGSDLSVRAAEPVRAAPFADTDAVPYLTRTLTCHAGTCTALSSGSVTYAKSAPTPKPSEAAPSPEAPAVPAPLALVTLPVRESPWKAPAFRDADEAPPRPTSVTALFDGDHLAKVGAAAVQGGALSAWVTYVVELSAGRGKRAKGDEASAVLEVRPVAADGTPGKPVTISRKAVSAGGLALAPAPAQEGKKQETALAWVARAGSEPQVQVTKLGPDGVKLIERGVTTVSRRGKKDAPPSEAFDVAVAYAGGEGSGGDGWIAAWVDSRDGNGEVYVAKLDRQLNKTVADKRVTEAPGDAAEVQLAVRGKEVLLVWSDSRAKPEDGVGDIYAARLDAATLKKTGAEVRLFASTGHSRTPQIVPSGKGFLVSWIEEQEGAKAGDAAGPMAGLRVAELDEKGVVVGAPQLVRGADAQGTVTSAALGCAGKICRGVLTTSVGDAMLLGAFELHPGAPAGPVKTIGALTGRGTQDVSPAFSSPSATSLFFADDAVGGTGRVRFMQIAWP